MTFLGPFLCFSFWMEKLVEVKCTKYDEPNGYNNPEGGIFSSGEKCVQPVAAISQESYSEEEVKIIASGSSTHIHLVTFRKSFFSNTQGLFIVLRFCKKENLAW